MNGIYSIKPGFQRLLLPLEDLAVARRWHPDLITGAALALSAACGICLAASCQPGLLGLLCLTPAFAFSRTALNALDGLVAKRRGMARPWGEVLNEFSDRLSDLFIFVGLAYCKYANSGLVLASLLAVFLSSFLGVLSKSAGGPRQFGGLMGKADRMVLLAFFGPLACLFAQFKVCEPGIVLNIFASLVLFGSLLTIWQRARKTYGDLESIN